MNNRMRIIVGVLGLVAVVIVVVFLLKIGGIGSEPEQEVSTADPINTVLDFYDPWWTAVKATSTDPYKEGLIQAPILGKDLRDKLKKAEKEHVETGLDPVLCQTKVPEQIAARSIYEREDSAQVLVMSRENGWTEQAIITLARYNGGWYIGDIECSPGEFAPDREFSFEMEGYLLKSVPPPLNSQYWHLVFEDNGEQGHTVVLLFDAQSMCKTVDGNESVCNPDSFKEPTKAYLRGSMLESGVEVKYLDLME